MFNVGDYLKRFASIGADTALLDSAVKKAITDHTSVPETSLKVTMKGSVAYISTDRAAKNLIFLSKGDILESIAKHGLRKKVSDIR